MKDNVATITEFMVENFLFAAPDTTLDINASFLENSIIDSTGILEVVAWVEEVFGIKVQDEEILPDNFDSVKLLDAFIARKLQG